MPPEMNADLRDRIAKYLAISDGLAWFLLADAEVEKYRRYSETAIREMLEWVEERQSEYQDGYEDAHDLAVRLKREAGL